MKSAGRGRDRLGVMLGIELDVELQPGYPEIRSPVRSPHPHEDLVQIRSVLIAAFLRADSGHSATGSAQYRNGQSRGDDSRNCSELLLNHHGSGGEISEALPPWGTAGHNCANHVQAGSIHKAQQVS